MHLIALKAPNVLLRTMSAIIHQGYVPAPALPHRKWGKSSYFFLDRLQLQEAIRHASW
jgi:hypothetical protein